MPHPTSRSALSLAAFVLLTLAAPLGQPRPAAGDPVALARHDEHPHRRLRRRHRLHPRLLGGERDSFSIFDLFAAGAPVELDFDPIGPGTQSFALPTGGHQWNFDAASVGTHTGWGRLLDAGRQRPPGTAPADHHGRMLR